MSRVSVVFGFGWGPENTDIDLRHVAFEQFPAAIQPSIEGVFRKIDRERDGFGFSVLDTFE
jgi:hypothetical protein